SGGSQSRRFCEPPLNKNREAQPYAGRTSVCTQRFYSAYGASFTVLDPLFAQGKMPHLKALADQGVRAELRTVPHPLTPPAWTTLVTGRGPGGHGIFDFLRAEMKGAGAYFTLSDFRDIKVET